MSTHLSDEEQLENLKRWWRENGTQLVLIVVLGAGGWFGWNYWKDSREARSQAASLAYDNLLGLTRQSEEFDQERLATLHAMAESIRDDHGRTPYAHLTALLQARFAVEAADYALAADHLRWILDDKPDDAIALVTRLRLARVLGEAGEIDEALAVLSSADAGEFSAQFAEVRGELLLRKGDTEGARGAWLTALAESGAENPSPLLQLRIEQLPSLVTEDARLPEEVDLP